MSLATAPRAGRWLGLLVLLLLGLPWLALVLAVLEGLRTEIGAAEPALAAAAATLPLGLPVAGFMAVEAMAYLLGSRLLMPAALLGQVAAAGAVLDFRHAPHPGEADEIGRLATAFGRFIRHLTRRRQELDWMADDIGGHALVEGAGDRAAALLARLAPEARFAAEDPAPAEPWLDAPAHRLLCGLAACAVGLAAAPLGPSGLVALVAVALLGGRLAEPLRRLGAVALWLALAAALMVWLLTDPLGPTALPHGLAVALAAGLAVHAGGGWRGPAGSAADAGWMRGGLAGAVAGGGVAAALVGLLGAATEVPLALMLAALVLAAAGLAPTAAVATPGNWPAPWAALRLLRQGAVRRVVLLGALPGGMVLGSAIGLACAESSQAVIAAVGASLLLALPGAGVVIPVRAGGLAAVGLLGGAALLLASPVAPLLPLLAATIAAVLAWPLAAPCCDRIIAPRQVAILAALARHAGTILALAGTALLPPAVLPAVAALALLPALLRPMREGS
jgi:HAMP domain-containing protein